MIDSDFNFDSTSSSLIVSADSPVVDYARERRIKSYHDCSTSGRINEEPIVHASPLTVITALGNAIGVLVYGKYGTIVGLAERSPLLFPLANPHILGRHGR